MRTDEASLRKRPSADDPETNLAMFGSERRELAISDAWEDEVRFEEAAFPQDGRRSICRVAGSNEHD
ncbi:uncharacterized protein PV09_04752 [Verruconis gallopava]|uniref:Uncharacterized protein n=1 Tax=Verruconis gallopava TaxID=253628 RepID=A0A0D2AXK0_9PEZI|nr:uncharacterized protein PV09_04752 [Verruconis gallopava]KIW03909.1 hypothetical protein PV09_04752 [Verruconis gallopava]